MIPRAIATALLAGIQSDTDFLSRSCSDEDFAAYAALYRAGDWELASRIVRTALDLREFGLIVAALRTPVVREGLLVRLHPGALRPGGPRGPGRVRAAGPRSSMPRSSQRRAAGVCISPCARKARSISAFALVRSALLGIGSGGGHAHSAGGVVPAGTEIRRGRRSREIFQSRGRRRGFGEMILRR